MLNSLLELRVLLDQVRHRLVRPAGLQVADLTEQLAHAGALSPDLRVCGLEPVFGVERAFTPGRPDLAAVLRSGRPAPSRRSRAVSIRFLASGFS